MKESVLMRVFTGKVLKDYCVNTNDFEYLEGQIIRVTKLNEFENSYGGYGNLDGYNVLDWIPKTFVKIN